MWLRVRKDQINRELCCETSFTWSQSQGGAKYQHSLQNSNITQQYIEISVNKTRQTCLEQKGNNA